MYSFNRHGYQQAYLKDLNQAKEVSKEYIMSCYPWPIAWSMSWLELRLVTDNDQIVKDPISILPRERRFLSKHLRRILHKTFAVHIYEKHFLENKSDNIAKKFLEIISQFYRKYSFDWLKNQKNVRLEFVVKYKDAPSVLESFPVDIKEFSGEPAHLGLWVNSLEGNVQKRIQKIN